MGTDAVFDEALAQANDHFERVIQTVIDHGIRQRQLAKKDTRGLARYLTGAVNGMVTLARGGTTRNELLNYIDWVMQAWPAATHD